MSSGGASSEADASGGRPAAAAALRITSAMALLIASDMHKDMAGQPLLRGVSFKLERRERMTIAGRNGAGKTTLLRMLAGETSIDRGELSVAKGVRIALHDQRPPRERGMALRDYVLSGCVEELQIEAELAELEARDGGGQRRRGAARPLRARAGAPGGARRLSVARPRDGDGARAGLRRATTSIAPLDTFSGGQLTRASLARALATGADVLLLDEPTNHLDIESLEWLEQTLVELDAAVVLVAHDRWFLEAVGTAVLELEAGRSRFFAGTWHQWRKEQAAREIALGRRSTAQQAEIARMERFIERFRYKATQGAPGAVAREEAGEDRADRARSRRPARAWSSSSPRRERSGRVIFELLDGRVEVGAAAGRCCSSTPSCGSSAASTSRWSGPNGSGKTTLIETLAGRRELAAGKLSTGHNVKVGYLSQHADELGAGGDPGQSVLDAAQRATGPDAGQGARAARALPVLRRGRRKAAGGAVGRRAQAPVAGDPRALGRERADPRRADEPPRHREPRGARGRAARVHRRGAARLARPRAARRRRHAHGRGRAALAAQLRRRLAGVRARARRAPRQRRRAAGSRRSAVGATLAGASDGDGRRRRGAARPAPAMRRRERHRRRRARRRARSSASRSRRGRRRTA